MKKVKNSRLVIFFSVLREKTSAGQCMGNSHQRTRMPYSAVYTVTIRVVDLNQTGSEPFTCRIVTRGNKDNINYSILKKILIHIRI